VAAKKQMLYFCCRKSEAFASLQLIAISANRNPAFTSNSQLPSTLRRLAQTHCSGFTTHLCSLRMLTKPASSQGAQAAFSSASATSNSFSPITN